MLITREDIQDFVKQFNELEDQVNNQTLTYEEYTEYVAANVEMPSFYTFEERSPIYLVEALENSIVLKHGTTGDSIATYTKEGKSVEEAYDLAHKTFNGDVKFIGDFTSIEGIDTSLGNSLTYKREGERTSRLLISHTSADSEYLAKAGYLGFLNTAEAYLGNPDDFLLSWEFINHHPAFWYRWNENHEHAWTTDNGVSKMWIQPTLNDEGNLVFMMEAGAAVPPARTTHYHDFRLDVWAPTYENGIIQTAALVHKFFHLDGSERENVEYQKSELELILEQRINELSQDDE